MSNHSPEDYRGPMLGALLRLSHRTIITEIMRRLAEAGYPDIHPPHTAITQPLYERTEGMRSTELAAYAKISKQAVKELVDDLQRLGYVQRVPDPTDRRAHRVMFTKRGWQLAQDCRDIVEAIESEVEATLGPEPLVLLRQSLQRLQTMYGSPHAARAQFGSPA